MYGISTISNTFYSMSYVIPSSFRFIVLVVKSFDKCELHKNFDSQKPVVIYNANRPHPFLFYMSFPFDIYECFYGLLYLGNIYL